MRNLFGLLLLSLLCSVFTLAQDAPPAEFGILKGTVKYDDGSLAIGIPVQIKAEKESIALSTGANGIFSGIVPAGDVAVTIQGTTQNVKVGAGETQTFDFTIKRTGVSVVLKYADGGAPARFTCSAAYRAPSGARSDLRASAGKPGAVTFPTVPADATEFAVLVYYDNITGVAARQTWKFDKQEALRTVEMTVPKVTEVSVTVTTREGEPIGNTDLRVYLSYPGNRFGGDMYWGSNDAPVDSWRSRNTLQLHSDANGQVKLGQFLPGKYTVRMTATVGAGAEVPFEVKADGTTDIKQYALLTSRKVLQVVFGRDGKPAANAQVFATYAWERKFVLRQAMTDAAGKVTWDELPPVRVIISGPKVAAGVITPDLSNITTALPAPVPEGNRTRYCNLELTVKGQGSIYVGGLATSGGGNNSPIATTVVPDAATGLGKTTSSMYLVSGRPFSLLIATTATPPQIALITDAYMPFMEDDDGITLSLPLTDAIECKGRLLNADGKPLAGVSRLRFVPESDTNNITALLNNENGQRIPLLRPRLQPDGTFRMTVPAAGNYRVLIDLYESTASTAQALIVAVPVGGGDLPIRLPQSLATVPAGAEVYWLTKKAPTTIRRMVTAAYAPSMPVFGPREELLALWYRPTPDKLVVCDASEGAWRQRMLTTRTVCFSTPPENSNFRFGQDISLLQLLPGQGRDGGYTDYSVPSLSETRPTQVQIGLNASATLWSGPYLVGNSYTPISITGIADVPPQDAMEIPIKQVTVKNMREMTDNRRTIRLKWSQEAFEVARKTTSRDVMMYTDISPYPYESGLWFNNGVAQISVPIAATTLTLQWPGVGYIRDMKIPAPQPGDNQPMIDLPAWQSCDISGTVLKPDGTPFAKTQISILTGGSDYGGYYVQTDADGKFTAKGMMPGTVVVWASYNNSGGWLLDVPEKGLAGVTLKMVEQPIQAYIPRSGGRTRAWWITDDGKYRRLAARDSNISIHDTKTEQGWLWALDETGRNGFYGRVTLAPGNNNLNDSMASTSTLAMYFPLDLAAGMPGGVTLTGQGPLAGINMVMPNFIWQPSSLLNIVVGQIAAIPPGDYQITVQTPRGPVLAPVKVEGDGGIVMLKFPRAAN